MLIRRCGMYQHHSEPLYADKTASGNPMFSQA